MVYVSSVLGLSRKILTCILIVSSYTDAPNGREQPFESAAKFRVPCIEGAITNNQQGNIAVSVEVWVPGPPECYMTNMFSSLVPRYDLREAVQKVLLEFVRLAVPDLYSCQPHLLHLLPHHSVQTDRHYAGIVC